MTQSESLERLRKLGAEAKKIRERMKVNAPGAVLFLASTSIVDDELVVVIANGFGGATTSVVEGNYPLDFISTYEKRHRDEASAISEAEAIAENGVTSVT